MAQEPDVPIAIALKWAKQNLVVLIFWGFVIGALALVAYVNNENKKTNVVNTVSSSSTTPTPTPTPAATPEVVNMPSAFSSAPGDTASLSAGTYPGSNCSITVNYLSGPSHAQGLSPQLADSSGQVKWSWVVGTNTTPGTWPIDVTCTLNGQTESGTTNMTVMGQMTQSQADAAANNLDQQIDDYYSNMGQ